MAPKNEVEKFLAGESFDKAKLSQLLKQVLLDFTDRNEDGHRFLLHNDGPEGEQSVLFEYPDGSEGK